MVNGVRNITEVKLYEVSAVTLAANDQALIMDVKGNYDPEKILKRYDNIARLIRKGNITDELGFALEAETLKLKSLFAKVATQPTDIEVTEPVEVKNDVSEMYQYLFNKFKNLKND